VRDQATSAAKKKNTYAWYAIKKPAINRGRRQVCELDHLVSLELGGADTLDNIWPQCRPSRVALYRRYFKQKDAVENYLAAQVRAGAIDLHDAQFCPAPTTRQHSIGRVPKCLMNSRTNTAQHLQDWPSCSLRTLQLHS
jgi:hypothetical protein